MLYQAELSFFHDICLRHHLRVSELPQDTPLSAAMREGAPPLLTEPLLRQIDRTLAGARLEEHTLYHLSTDARLSYAFLLLPPVGTRLLLVGPFLDAPLSETDVAELCEDYGLSPSCQRRLGEYYTSIPVVDRAGALFSALHTLCERVFQRPSFAVVRLHGTPHTEGAAPISPAEAPDDLTVSMRALEQRYAFENELIRAVSLGQLHKEEQLLSALSQENFERRTPDAVRNAKNYGIIMNTLLRKAAEDSGVHPLHLDATSSHFAKEIEAMTSLAQSDALMRDMFVAYCRLVRSHTLRGLSPTVQKTVLLIDADLSAPLSAASIAKGLGVTVSYLSTVFRREMGVTLSAYIRDKRMEHAARLLCSSQLQIQTVAQHCGILDVQYFSKLFRRHTGCTPRQFRASMRKGGDTQSKNE